MRILNLVLVGKIPKKAFLQDLEVLYFALRQPPRRRGRSTKPRLAFFAGVALVRSRQPTKAC